MPLSLRSLTLLGADGVPLRTPAPSPERVLHAVFGLLEQNGLCAWATVTEARSPHVHTAYFAHAADLRLAFLSHPRSQHVANLSANPAMAVAVFDSTQNWLAPGRGLQLFGSCAAVSGADAEEAERLYGERYQQYTAWKATLRPGDAGLDYRFYRFTTDRLKLLDEGAFGDGVFVTAEVVRAPA